MDFKKQTYTDHVVTYIKQSILDGTYKPGSKVKELVIAKKLSISRAPIREALQILIKEGLVVWTPQKGKFITKLDPKQIRDSYFTGGILEAAAVCSVIQKYTARDIKSLEELAEKMRLVAENGEPIETLAPLDDKFHQILFSRIDNELLLEFCRRACQGISKFLLFRYWIQLYSVEEVYWRHKNIVDSLRKGDVYELEGCIRNHYLDAGKRMSEICRRETEK
ncbi:GntR family transcriptional regulator [Desulfopila aestuarii]|uniref:Transcriptional regulator, GntR family n=1 Tax=Desulfopila aestuarii DSM 18488 TaxID=1121416 RepID=A0A1M7YG30_9BACT|nr:GntR family transcriptional regulator [Desulfopila aestuarii]SHO51595.1 transcriptional regulator, GntR family [Desulfopila aestuarii DSM 18488]